MSDALACQSRPKRVFDEIIFLSEYILLLFASSSLVECCLVRGPYVSCAITLSQDITDIENNSPRKSVEIILNIIQSSRESNICRLKLLSSFDE